MDLLSKNTAKKPITEEEQNMLDTIALKVHDIILLLPYMLYYFYVLVV